MVTDPTVVKGLYWGCLGWRSRSRLRFSEMPLPWVGGSLGEGAVLVLWTQYPPASISGAEVGRSPLLAAGQ